MKIEIILPTKLEALEMVLNDEGYLTLYEKEIETSLDVHFIIVAGELIFTYTSFDGGGLIDNDYLKALTPYFNILIGLYKGEILTRSAELTDEANEYDEAEAGCRKHHANKEDSI